jgi:hypothetical protein
MQLPLWLHESRISQYVSNHLDYINTDEVAVSPRNIANHCHIGQRHGSDRCDRHAVKREWSDALIDTCTAQSQGLAALQCCLIGMMPEIGTAAGHRRQTRQHECCSSARLLVYRSVTTC